MASTAGRPFDNSPAQSAQHKAANQVRADQSTFQINYARTCFLRPVCFPGAWGSWHLHLGICILASASRQVAPKRDLSVRFTSLVEQAQRAAEAACGAKRLVRIVDTEVPNFVDSSDGLADSQPWS